jgi:hypothetical protein
MFEPRTTFTLSALVTDSICPTRQQTSSGWVALLPCQTVSSAHDEEISEIELYQRLRGWFSNYMKWRCFRCLGGFLIESRMSNVITFLGIQFKWNCLHCLLRGQHALDCWMRHFVVPHPHDRCYGQRQYFRYMWRVSSQNEIYLAFGWFWEKLC